MPIKSRLVEMNVIASKGKEDRDLHSRQIDRTTIDDRANGGLFGEEPNQPKMNQGE
jgi:hypothetical protein